MRSHILKSLLLILTFSFAQNLLAKDYQIELIIFEHIYDSSSPEADSRADMEIPYVLLNEMRPTTPDTLVLSEEAKRVKGSRNFRYIGHASWIQEGLSREDAGYVNLDSWLAGSGIQGTATVYLNRYLHLDVQLSKEETNSQMSQKRRMRSKELHYIDHPKFGILAQITPVE